MKKFIFHALLFMFIVGFLAIGLNAALGRYNDEPEHYALQYRELATRQVNANVIIIGSSHGSHSMRPSVLNTGRFTFYNFALNGGNPQFYFHWYREAFKGHYPKPEYCIYAVDWFLFNEYWLWRQFVQDSEFFTEDVFRRCLESAEFNRTSLICNRFPLLKYREPADLGKALFLKIGDKRFPAEEYDDGFIPYRIPYDPAVLQPPPLEENAWISGRKQDYLERLIQQLQADSIPLIFIMPPEHGIVPEQYKVLKSFQHIMKVATRYNIPVLNYNIERRSEINSCMEYFSDWGHMNTEGSMVFSTLLREDLRAIMEK